MILRFNAWHRDLHNRDWTTLRLRGVRSCHSYSSYLRLNLDLTVFFLQFGICDLLVVSDVNEQHRWKFRSISIWIFHAILNDWISKLNLSCWRYISWKFKKQQLSFPQTYSYFTQFKYSIAAMSRLKLEFQTMDKAHISKNITFVV